jgi:hypothetical protein
MGSNLDDPTNWRGKPQQEISTALNNAARVALTKIKVKTEDINHASTRNNECFVCGAFIAWRI